MTTRSGPRILFTFAGGSGHFIPLIPIARAAEQAGHVVAFGGQAALLASVERARFTAFDTADATFRDDRARSPLLKLDMEREYRAVREGYAGRIARRRAPAILDLCARWKPDLLVCDEMDFGAMVAAEHVGVLHASVSVIATGGLTPRDLIAEPLNVLRAEHGLPVDPDLAMLSRHLVISPFPPTLRDPAFAPPPTLRAFRPAGDGPEAPVIPDWLARLPLGPTVYLTLGTVFNVESGDLFGRLLQGLARLPINLIVTVGSQIDPEELGPQPANVRIERFIDQWALLPRCDLVVSHAGSGTVVGALAHGLPMVLLPMGADQPLNAKRCATLGVARVLDPIEATPGQIEEAADALLADAGPRRAAERIRDEIAGLPELSQSVRLLEQLVDEGPVEP